MFQESDTPTDTYTQRIHAHDLYYPPLVKTAYHVHSKYKAHGILHMCACYAPWRGAYIRIHTTQCAHTHTYTHVQLKFVYCLRFPHFSHLHPLPGLLYLCVVFYSSNRRMMHTHTGHTHSTHKSRPTRHQPKRVFSPIHNKLFRQNVKTNFTLDMCACMCVACAYERDKVSEKSFPSSGALLFNRPEGYVRHTSTHIHTHKVAIVIPINTPQNSAHIHTRQRAIYLYVFFKGIVANRREWRVRNETTTTTTLGLVFVSDFTCGGSVGCPRFPILSSTKCQANSSVLGFCMFSIRKNWENN